MYYKIRAEIIPYGAIGKQRLHFLGGGCGVQKTSCIFVNT